MVEHSLGKGEVGRFDTALGLIGCDKNEVKYSGINKTDRAKARSQRYYLVLGKNEATSSNLVVGSG